jgi:hypothetical protein
MRFLRNSFEHYLKTDYWVKINTAVQMIKKLRTITTIAYEIGWITRDPFIAYRAWHDTIVSETDQERKGSPNRTRTG